VHFYCRLEKDYLKHIFLPCYYLNFSKLHSPALLRRLHYFGATYKYPELLTYRILLCISTLKSVLEVIFTERHSNDVCSIIIIIAVEILGPIHESASDFLSLLAKKIGQHSGDERETAFLFQRISALVQHDSFVREDYPE